MVEGRVFYCDDFVRSPTPCEVRSIEERRASQRPLESVPSLINCKCEASAPESSVTSPLVGKRVIPAWPDEAVVLIRFTLESRKRPQLHRRLNFRVRNELVDERTASQLLHFLAHLEGLIAGGKEFEERVYQCQLWTLGTSSGREPLRLHATRMSTTPNRMLTLIELSALRNFALFQSASLTFFPHMEPELLEFISLAGGTGGLRLRSHYLYSITLFLLETSFVEGIALLTMNTILHWSYSSNFVNSRSLLWLCNIRRW